ncbi:MAG: hypothetical protein DI586_01860 [Micavibrio aeruginosavorus]|uniref:Uncharacterized protein n=1 Tax=Micavibrio aeruginosavorus TaxID=349221 RepID=A0A2W5HTN1_9BACT|nr:MAG: hypothetical protein DI586_01860 [Micavibrio aeruginosavorus]
MSRQKISDALVGCLEIPIFIKGGIDRFENTAKAARFSFIVPVVLLPFGAYLAQINPEFNGRSLINLLIIFAVKFGLFSVLYLGAVFIFVKQFDRHQFFYQFVNAQNWMILVQLVILLPVLLGVQAGRWPWEDIYNFQVFLIVYSYVFMAFLITCMFRIN